MLFGIVVMRSGERRQCSAITSLGKLTQCVTAEFVVQPRYRPATRPSWVTPSELAMWVTESLVESALSRGEQEGHAKTGRVGSMNGIPGP